jgi:hypothetical protein
MSIILRAAALRRAMTVASARPASSIIITHASFSSSEQMPSPTPPSYHRDVGTNASGCKAEKTIFSEEALADHSWRQQNHIWCVFKLSSRVICRVVIMYLFGLAVELGPKTS